MEEYENNITQAAKIIKNAQHILIGAGAGLSTAAGLTYSGKRFSDKFPEFIKKYGMRDMYSAGFFPFPTEESLWGYWSKHSIVNRIEPPAMPLYQELFELVNDKDYYVLTTNVDHQFHKAGFSKDRIFATQGDYGLIQCAKGCHQKTYEATELFIKMNNAREDCNIPSSMVPRCPVCGGPMAMNLRCDQFFVEDEDWHEAAHTYKNFLSDKLNRKDLVLLELGVGFNTPGIIRYPFERMVHDNSNVKMVRINLDESGLPESSGDRAVGINEDISEVIEDIRRQIS